MKFIYFFCDIYQIHLCVCVCMHHTHTHIIITHTAVRNVSHSRFIDTLQHQNERKSDKKVESENELQDKDKSCVQG